MTLTRPAYEVTVENLDTAWSTTVAAGDTFDPNAGAWVADDLELSWRFEETPPAQLEPETAKFAILADGIANLPSFALGDRVRIELVRPTLADPIPYMTFAGRVTDSGLETEAKSGRLMLKLTAVDPTSEVANTRYYAFDDDANTAHGFANDLETVFVRAVQGMARADAYVSPTIVFDQMCYPTWVPDTTYAEAVRQLLAGGLGDDGFPVQRYAVDPLGGGWGWNAPAWFLPAKELDWNFYMATWDPALSGAVQALFTWAWSASDADQVTSTPAATPPDPDGPVIVLDSCFLPDNAEWFRDRSAAPNVIGVTGWNTTTSPSEMVGPRFAISADSVERYGRLERPTIETGRDRSERRDLAARYLELVAPNAGDVWQFDSLPVLTHVMDDAELDAMAPLFWTEREPVPGTMGRRVVVRNVDDDVDPTGGLLITHLAGATFRCQNGRLEITPDLVPAPMPGQLGVTAGPTYDAFDASAFGAATYQDQGGATDYIAGAITFDRAKFTSL